MENVIVKIIKGFEEDEASEVFETLNTAATSITESIFKEEMESKERFIKLVDAFPDTDSFLEVGEYLKGLGIPFVIEDRTNNKMVVFDGVREGTVDCDNSGIPLIPMQYIRDIIDILEVPETEDAFSDLKALVRANEYWTNTDIDTMWRYGMEKSVAFSSNFAGEDDSIIDVEAEEENSGNPEISKKINN